MKAKPKYQSVLDRPKAIRRFTDREDQIEVFMRKLEEEKDNSPKVLVYYGVGGIGKTSLQNELIRLINDKNLGLVARLDFRNAGLRNHDAAIFALRKQLGDLYKISFPRFDIAYAVYWQKSNPQLSLNDAKLSLLESSEILSSILDIAGEAPVFGVAVNLVRAASRLASEASSWVQVLRDPDLKTLDQLEPYQILYALNYFFAQDLRSFATNTNKQILIFMDTYEALFKDSESLNLSEVDGWLRDVILQLPEALWVICGREFVRWSDFYPEWSPPVLEQHIVGKLSKKDGDLFLAESGVKEEDIRSKLVIASKGVPLYLDISVDHYNTLLQQKSPDVGDFGKTQIEIMNQFVNHLPKGVSDALEILAVSRFWDKNLFEEVVRHFNINIPITRYDEFCAYSFNYKDDLGYWHMHELMQEELQKRLASSFVSEIRELLFGYFNAYMNSAIKEEDFQNGARLFIECLYHGARTNVLSPQWFYEFSEIFMHRGYWALLEVAYLDARAALDNSSNPKTRVLVNYYLAWIHQEKGRLIEAQEMFDQLDISLLDEFRNSVMFHIAYTVKEGGNYDRAANIYEGLFKDLRQSTDRKLYLLVGAQYADMQYVQGKFKAATGILRELVSENDPSALKENGELFRILGHVYRMNELRLDALEYYYKSRVYFEKANDIYGLARIETNMVETLCLVDPQEAVSRGEKAISLNENLGSMLEVGKACNALAMSHLLLGNSEMAKKYNYRAEEIQENIGYKSGIGMALVNRMFILAKDGNIEQAKIVAKEAIELFQQIKAYPLLIYISSQFLDYLNAPDPNILLYVQEASSKLVWLDTKTKLDMRLQSMFKKIVDLNT